MAALLGFLLSIPTLAAPKWVAIGEFQAGGEVKAAAFIGTILACRFICTEGMVTVNACVVLEAQDRTPLIAWRC